MGRGPGRWWWRVGAGGAALLLALTAAACSDGGGDDGGETDGGDGGLADGGLADGEALVAAFDEAAGAAYAELGGDREQHHTEGIVLRDDCFALDGAAASAIIEALGLDPEGAVVEDVFLQGVPGESEFLYCTLSPADTERGIAFRAGTTSYDRDGLVDLARQGDARGPIEELEGEVPGLDPDEVLAIALNQGQTVAFSWVADGFMVSVGYPTALADPDGGFAALSEAVSGVTRALAAS
ncbi:MAG TPA: hypothetical protein VIL48_06490 [Acidimicrobiales bacterium]